MKKFVRTEKIDITPDTSLYPKIGKSGYTLTQSIAELVDNSIDARISNQILKIKVVLQKDFIIVEDNALGMNRDKAGKALILGYSTKKNVLGEFGLGLKSACTSLGRTFTLRTEPKEFNYGYSYQYDQDRWESKNSRNDWTDELKVFEKDKNKHGTRVKIENLNRRVNKQRKRDVLKDFSNRFAPFINSKEVKIFVNQEECVPETLDLKDGSKTEFSIPLGNGKEIYGWHALMKKRSDKGFYGFNTFRRGRMITSFDKIGIPHHPTISRITGAIHLDFIPVSHNKKSFETESNEYQQAEKLLTKEFKILVRKARQASLSAKVTKAVKDKTESWKKALVSAFHHDISDLLDSEPLRKKRSNNKRDPVGEIIIERRDPKMQRTIKEIVAKRKRTRQPREKRQKIVSHFVTIGGRNFTINHDFQSLGKDASWKAYVEEAGVIEVFTNQDFPAYTLTTDTAFYAAIHIAESLAEIVVSVNKYDASKVNEIKEKLLRGASKGLEQLKQ